MRNSVFILYLYPVLSVERPKTLGQSLWYAQIAAWSVNITTAVYHFVFGRHGSVSQILLTSVTVNNLRHLFASFSFNSSAPIMSIHDFLVENKFKIWFNVISLGLLLFFVSGVLYLWLRVINNKITDHVGRFSRSNWLFFWPTHPSVI